MTSPAEMWLDAERAAAAGQDLAASGRQIRDLRDGVGGEMAALSGARPWGTDDIGSAFERNYRPAEEQFLHAWTLLARHVEGLGAEVVEAVRGAVDTDERSGARVRHTYGKSS